MSALDTAIDKMDGVRLAVQNGQMPRGSDLYSLQCEDRADVVVAYLQENPEQLDDCLDDFSNDAIAYMLERLAARDYKEAGRIMALTIANTPAGGDILGRQQKAAERAIYEREQDNAAEQSRLNGAVVRLVARQ